MALFEQLGGEPGIRALVDAFYDEMDQNPAAAPLRAMHPDLPSARDKLFWFLVGWTGGPALYVERFGHPRLRARHMPFAIGNAERDQWRMCMDVALAATVPDFEVRGLLAGNFDRLADHMRNREG